MLKDVSLCFSCLEKEQYQKVVARLQQYQGQMAETTC